MKRLLEKFFIDAGATGAVVLLCWLAASAYTQFFQGEWPSTEQLTLTLLLSLIFHTIARL